MDKLQWLQMRKAQELPIRACYEYYNDVAPPWFKRYSYEEFEHHYAEYTANCSLIPCLDTQGQPKKFEFDSVIKKIHEHFDNKFNT